MQGVVFRATAKGTPMSPAGRRAADRMASGVSGVTHRRRDGARLAAVLYKHETLDHLF